MGAVRVGFGTWISPTRPCELARKWSVDCNAGKTQLISFNGSNNSGAIDLKKGWPSLDENAFFIMLGLSLFSKLDWGSYIVCIPKTAFKKIGTLIHSMKLLFEGLYKSANLPPSPNALSRMVLLICMEHCCRACCHV